MDIYNLNDNLTNVILESALEERGKALNENIGNLSTTTKGLKRKRNKIRNKIEVVELSNIINKRKTNDIQKYNMKIIEETLTKDTSMKIARRTFGLD